MRFNRPEKLYVLSALDQGLDNALVSRRVATIDEMETACHEALLFAEMAKETPDEEEKEAYLRLSEIETRKAEALRDTIIKINNELQLVFQADASFSPRNIIAEMLSQSEPSDDTQSSKEPLN